MNAVNAMIEKLMARFLPSARTPTGAQQGSTAPGLVGPVGFDEPVTAEQLANALPEAVVLFDAQGRSIFANDRAQELFGPLDPGLQLRRKFRAPEMQSLIDGVLSGGHSDSVEFSERTPIERWFRATVRTTGEPEPQFVLTLQDQSDQHRIDRMRADFIANASHELRTPLASIIGFLETLEGPARNDEKAREKFLAIMQEQTGRMARLIDDLLSLSRLETRAGDLVREEVDVGKIIRHVVDSLKHLASELGVRVEVKISGEPLITMGDRDELIQVFQNLLENACKYGQSGERVTVSAGIGQLPDGGEEIRVSVRDHGPGIAQEHIPRLTERFYRVDVETSRAQKGTGLGLSIVKHILARHKSRLSISSELGEGAAFHVHLTPARQ